jgi:hypothetical protein
MPFICGDGIGDSSGGRDGTDATKKEGASGPKFPTPQLGDLMAMEKPLIVVR